MDIRNRNDLPRFANLGRIHTPRKGRIREALGDAVSVSLFAALAWALFAFGGML